MVRCHSVWVKFKNPNKHGQNLTSGEITGTECLQVIVNPPFLNIVYVNKVHPTRPYKIVSFSLDDVHETMFENGIEVDES